MDVKRRQWFAPGQEGVDALGIGQKWNEPRLALENHSAAALLDQRQIAEKLQGIAKTLVGEHQDRAPLTTTPLPAGERGEGRTVPTWLGKSITTITFGLPT